MSIQSIKNKIAAMAAKVGLYSISKSEFFGTLNDMTDEIKKVNDNVNSVAKSLIWQAPVVDVAALATTYPTPTLGWAAMVTSLGFVYSWNGTAWKDTGLNSFPNSVIVKSELEFVQNQINNIVIESGTSSAEVLQARGNYAVLNERLSNSDIRFSKLNYYLSDFEGNTNQIKLQNILSFIGSIKATILISEQIDIAGNLIIPENITLIFRGGYLNIISGETTIKGYIESQIVRIFNGNIKLTTKQEVYPQWFGVITGNGADFTAELERCFSSGASVIRFTSGIYQAYFNNYSSNRTFIFDEGSIIDGVIHLAIGSGPEMISPLSVVKDIRVIGVATSTIRVGTYYCQGINVDKIRITDANPAYVNQTAEGGSRGVHFYFGSKDIVVGEIDTRATKASDAAFFIDTNVILDSTHRPNNIKVGLVHVRTAGISAVSITNTDKLTIDRIIVDKFGAYNGIQFSGSDVTIGRIDIDGSATIGAFPNVYILNNLKANIGEIISTNSKGRGVYVYNSTFTTINRIEVSGCAGDGVRLLSEVSINEIITHNNSEMGLYLMEGSSSSRIRHVDSYNNLLTNIYVEAVSDVLIESIITHHDVAGGSWGLAVAECTGFKNNYLRSYKNTQGFRYSDNVNSQFGTINITESTLNDIVLGGINSGIIILKAIYTTISGELTDISGYKTFGNSVLGSIVRNDVSVTLKVGVDCGTQRFYSALTANRTITLSPLSATAGDRFRIVRMAESTGSFSLNVGDLKSLATSQWCDVEWTGTTWALVASGSL